MSSGMGGGVDIQKMTWDEGGEGLRSPPNGWSHFLTVPNSVCVMPCSFRGNVLTE